MRIRRHQIALTVACASLAFQAAAAPYPSQPVRAVVSNAPGTGTHITARFLANSMSKTWGVPVVVDDWSASQAALEVASGRTQVGFNGTGMTLPLLHAGEIRILALVRAGTPQAVVDAIGSALTDAAPRPEFKALCEAQGLDVAIQEPAELKGSAPKEFDKALRLIELAGIKASR